MNIASFSWDPSREVFFLPLLHFPILWYSLLFAAGFLGSYFFFTLLLQRYFLQSPLFTEQDVLSFASLLELLQHPQTDVQMLVQKRFFSLLDAPKKKILLSAKEGDPSKQKILLITLNRLLDDSELMAHMKLDTALRKLSCQPYYRNATQAAMRLFFEKVFASCCFPLKKKVSSIAEKLFIAMMVATVVGARLGHLLFYEDFSFYLSNPLRILKTWEGGLASHGAAGAILLSLFFFCRSIKKRFSYSVDWKSVLDLMAAPAAFCAVCIRVGNFFNQEILGTPSSLPWSVIFGHPMDGGTSVPRHPAQLYEAFFYLCVFLSLFYLSRKPRFLLHKGRLIGLFLISVFSFRFLIEFLKEEQSLLLNGYSFLEMGQYLSIPFIVLGLFLFFWRDSKQKYDESLFS